MLSRRKTPTNNVYYKDELIYISDNPAGVVPDWTGDWEFDSRLSKSKDISNRYLSLGIIRFCLLLFYAIATVFQLYHGGVMTYEMGRRKPDPTL